MKKLKIMSQPHITSFDHPKAPFQLTIIIPLSSQSKYLPILLKSINDSFLFSDPNPATTRSIQCLFVDDGSEPAMEWILMYILDSWDVLSKNLIHCFYHRINNSKNGNWIHTSARLSTGKWHIFLNNTNQIPKNFFSKIIPVLHSKNSLVVISPKSNEYQTGTCPLPRLTGQLLDKLSFLNRLIWSYNLLQKILPHLSNTLEDSKQIIKLSEQCWTDIIDYSYQNSQGTYLLCF
tara:strand:+ start:120 stop:821 length:702 start_codon:yes stop_codon:yes gene_type:complete